MIEKLIKIKTYFLRAYGWVAPVSIIIAIYNYLLSQRNIFGIKLYLSLTIIVMLCIIIGWADIKFKVMQREITFSNNQNKELQKLLKNNKVKQWKRKH